MNFRSASLLLAALALAACASSNTEDDATGTTGGTDDDDDDDGGDGGSDGGGAAATTSATTGGTTTSTTSTTTSTGSGEGGGGTGGSSSSTGGGTPVGGNHLLIDEVSAEPTTAEFIEIFNPSNEAVSLGDVYLSDNATYHTITDGTWDPVTDNPGTDWIAQFPAGSSIAAGGRIVVAGRNATAEALGVCPDYSWAQAFDCGGELMEEPVDGGFPDPTDGVGHLSDSREMVVLFRWSGNAGDPVEDLDYVTWGAEFEEGTRVDKTGVDGYVADTAPASQRPATEADQETSISRCAAESDETQSGGNGVDGHDETSENLGASFEQTTKTPGAANACP